jgi:hypothetical protein
MDFMNSIFVIEQDNKSYKSRKEISKIIKETNLDFKIHNNFDDLDWSKEPSEHLDWLFRERAKQIRETHDYLILYFSGGSDSITVLNAFINNNIPLDEVVINCYSEIEADVVNCDYAKKYLKTKSFRGKITVVDINLKMLNDINKNYMWEEYENFTGLLHNYLRFDIDFFEKNDLVDHIHRKGTVAHIFGSDYPIVVKEDENFYCILSSSDLSLPPHSHKSVSFFTTQDMPELHLKQCHVLAKYMKKNELYAEEECKACIRDEFNPLMYATKTAGNFERQFSNRSESSFILNKYLSDDTFKDIYKNVIYKDVLKPMMKLRNLVFRKKYLLF